MASDALFQALAEAIGRPSKTYQAIQEGLQIPGKYMEGKLQRKDYDAQLRKDQLEQQTLGDSLNGQPLDQGIMNLTGESGAIQHPNLAAAIALQKVRQAGLPKPLKPGDTYTPEQTAAVSSGDPAQLAKAFGGVVPRTAVAANTTSRGVLGRNEFYGTRAGSLQAGQLPSERPTSDPAGAAYQIKIAARMGKTLISKATTPQDLALVNSDLSRAVNRSAPLSETINAGNYGQSLPTLLNLFQQRMTADPNGKDVPLIRKKIYDTFNELENASSPYIGNALYYMEANGLNNSYGNKWNDVKNMQMGNNMPDVPFVENPPPTMLPSSAQNPNVSTGIPQIGGTFQGGKVLHVEKISQ